MAKRKNKQSQSQTQQNSGQHQAKRLRPNNYNDGGDDSHGGKFDASRGYVDPSTGQRGAFPGLENCDEDFFGPPQDGLDYLRMVRSEAKGVPSLLLSAEATANAPPPPRERPPPPLPPPSRERPVANPDDVVLDYDDPPSPSTPFPSPPESEHPPPTSPTPSSEDPHYYFAESTYISLHPTPLPLPPPAHHTPTISRFTTLRNRLSASPPTLSRPSFPKWKDNKAWRDFVSSTMPQKEWVWAMQQWEVVRLVKEFTAWMGWRVKVRNAAKKGVAKGWAVWIWALLVRCEIVMCAEEVSVIRELGKVALVAWKVLRVFRDEEGWEDEVGSEETTEEDRREGTDPVGGEDCAPRNSEAQELEEGEEPEDAPPPKIEFYNLEDTMGMMDMIVSIVGDFFGQRDLLGERAALG